MKVLIVGHSYLAVENRKQLSELSRFINIEVASPNRFGGMLFDYDIRDNSIVGKDWRISLYRKLSLRFLPDSVYIFGSITLGMRSFKPDIIHIEADPFHPLFISSYLLSRIWARKAKVVCTIRQNTFTERNLIVDSLKDFLARFFIRRVDQFLSVNRGVEKLYRTRFRALAGRFNYCTQIGVDISRFSPAVDRIYGKHQAFDSIDHGDALIGYCGRFVEYKGVSDLVSAVERLRITTNSDYRLVLLGDGPMRGQLTQMAKGMKWLTVLETVPHADVSQFLTCLDVFVMPSRVLCWHVEHDAHALLEAMATGLPCVATKSGANSDVLADAGILVDAEDTIAMAEAIRKLVDNAGLSNSLGKIARKTIVDKYSMSAVATRYMEVYQRALVQ